MHRVLLFWEACIHFSFFLSFLFPFSIFLRFLQFSWIDIEVQSSGVHFAHTISVYVQNTLAGCRASTSLLSLVLSLFSLHLVGEKRWPLPKMASNSLFPNFTYSEERELKVWKLEVTTAFAEIANALLRFLFFMNERRKTKIMSCDGGARNKLKFTCERNSEAYAEEKKWKRRRSMAVGLSCVAGKKRWYTPCFPAYA